MRINFVTNQNLKVTSGGWSGINSNLYNQLKEKYELNYVGPVAPKSFLFEKIVSKTNRLLGLKGNFHFFSNKRLDLIKKIVSKEIKDSDYNFFFGQTPWVGCEFDTPYGVYLDASFLTYMEIYSDPKKFNKNDLLRISGKEGKWLQKAKHIFVGSQWTWDEMIKHYDLDESQKIIVHTGGNIELPSEDIYNGELNFVFISLNFVKKGGAICIETFKKIRAIYNNATLTIIGEKPSDDILNIEGVVYAGLLNKLDSNDLQKFRDILSGAFLLIHPTVMDTMGAVLIEAGYFGCPSIAPKSFGIPELIINNKTGLTVDVPFNSEDFSSKIINLIKNRDEYVMMRENVWKHTHSNLTWENIGSIINKHINENINS